MSEEKVYERFAEICVGPNGDVIVNYPLGTSYEQILTILERAVVSVVKMRDGHK